MFPSWLHIGSTSHLVLRIQKSPKGFPIFPQEPLSETNLIRSLTHILASADTQLTQENRNPYMNNSSQMLWLHFCTKAAAATQAQEPSDRKKKSLLYITIWYHLHPTPLSKFKLSVVLVLLKVFFSGKEAQWCFCQRCVAYYEFRALKYSGTKHARTEFWVFTKERVPHSHKQKMYHKCNA